MKSELKPFENSNKTFVNVENMPLHHSIGKHVVDFKCQSFLDASKSVIARVAPTLIDRSTDGGISVWLDELEI